MTPMLSPARAILYGGLVVGILDLLDALVFFGFRGVAPIRIPQSIAAGLLGRNAFAGGLATAALGLVLHFLIATAIVATFVALVRRVPRLRRPWLLWGALYGIAVYLVMNRVVIPLSASPGTWPPPAPVLLNGVLIHIFGVGIPSAWFAARTPPPALADGAVRPYPATPPA